MTLRRDDLAKRRTNNQVLIDQWLAGLRERDGTMIEHDALGCAESYRQLAAIAWIADADVAAFHRNLFSAAVCKLFYYAKLIEGAVPFEDDAAARTFDLQFFDALAAQQLQLALGFTCYQLPPNDEWDEPEPTRFLLYLQSLVNPALASAKMFEANGVEAWIKSDEESTRRRVCAALAAKDPKELVAALKSLADERDAALANDEALPWEDQFLYIEALGIGWLARQQGIKFKFEHRLVPAELQAEHHLAFPLDGLPLLSGDERKRLNERLSAKMRKPFSHPYLDPRFLATA